MPDLDAEQLRQAHQHVVEVLEVLVQDQAMRVRQILSDTLKDLASAPPNVIRPRFGGVRPRIERISVVLPEPLEPNRHVILAVSAARETSSRTSALP